jgi:hypothetical protein
MSLIACVASSLVMHLPHFDTKAYIYQNKNNKQ